MARKKQHATGEPPIPEAARPAYEAVVGLIDAFCREHLDEEYRTMCRRLASTLARKRPSPLLTGKPQTWACGIIRTIGWVNFLDDRTRQPHLKLTAIDKVFGVADSTGQGKSKTIRTMLKIRSFDPKWTLPSRMGYNPRAWIIQVNGLLDARYLRQEIQGEAYSKGLIPYIPADREHDSPRSDPWPARSPLASGGADRVVRVWDLATRQQRAALTGHTGFIESIAFSPDGKTLVTAATSDGGRPALGRRHRQSDGDPAEIEGAGLGDPELTDQPGRPISGGAGPAI